MTSFTGCIVLVNTPSCHVDSKNKEHLIHLNNNAKLNEAKNQKP